MTITRYTSTEEFGSADWDCFHSGEFYFKYEFLKVVEQAGVNEASFKFLTFCENGVPKGAVVISKFILQLDLLSGNPLPLRLIKKVYPRVLQFPLVCCGLPVSFGQNHLAVLDDSYLEKIMLATDKEIEAFAAVSGCKLWAWKEIAPEGKGTEILRKNSYLQLPSLPDTSVIVQDGGLDSYIGSLRSQYRRKIRKSVERMQKGNGEIKVLVKAFEKVDVEGFYIGYLAVIERTAVKLEVYPKRFFELLTHKELNATLLTISSKEDTMTALLLPDAHALNFILVAKKKEKYEGALYTELIRAIIVYGLSHGHKIIKMGQTSYYAKMSAGAKAVPLSVFLKTSNRRIRFILKNFGKWLFPSVQLPELTPFR